MSKLKEILEKYQIDEVETSTDEDFDSLDDLALDEDIEQDDFADIITDIYNESSQEERAILDEMLSSDEGYEELLEMIAEAEECDDSEEEDGDDKKKKKKSKKDDDDDDDDDKTDDNEE